MQCIPCEEGTVSEDGAAVCTPSTDHVPGDLPSGVAIANTNGVEIAEAADGSGQTYAMFKTPGETYSIDFARDAVIEVLIVGGGGGGGGGAAGGGGGGGLVHAVNLTVPKGSVSISVGAGGLGSKTQVDHRHFSGANGQDSLFGSLRALGGGGGGAEMDSPANDPLRLSKEGGSGMYCSTSALPWMAMIHLSRMAWIY